MLLELKVNNFAIIENISLSFKKGLNILSGETGAGKSVILKSLTLLMGEKATAESVRSGNPNATVEGAFDITHRLDIIEELKNLSIENEDNTLIVRRIISSNGKNKIYINNSLVTLATLQSIVSPLIEVTGHKTPLIELTSQHENKNLMNKTYHLEVLDYYSGCTDLRNQFSNNYLRLKEIQKQISQVELQSKTSEQKIDFLKFQKEEIESLKLLPGQECDLESEYFKQKNASKITQFLVEVENALFDEDDSALVRIQKVIHKSNEYSSSGEVFKKLFEPLTQAKNQLDEFLFQIRTFTKEFTTDLDSLSELEQKISTLRKLQKKYGESVSDILKAHSEIVKQLENLENSDQRLQDLKNELEKILNKLFTLGKDLHKRRTSGAILLSQSVNDELHELNMKGVQFLVEVEQVDQMNPHGVSDIEFKIQNNVKDEPRSISKFASGGELSRILLSLKKVVGLNELPRTYLFDEVDAGVSGLTAEKVGKKLKSISKNQQVICVTHLAQVAAFADTHFLIDKSITKKGTQMNVIELKKSEREREIARLISGEKITKTSLEHARSLLKDI